MKKNKKSFLLILVCAVAALLLTFLLSAFSIVAYGKTDERTPCDVIIVLGAGTWEGKVSPVYRERIRHGVFLYEEGYAPHLFLAGGTGEGNSLSDAAAARAYAISLGVPEDAISIEERSTITEENLLYARQWMSEEGLTTALVVSDPLHMKRAMTMAEDYGICAYSSPTTTTMYQSLRTKLPFLLRETFFYVGYRLVKPFR